MQTVYIETSVISYLTARLSRDPVAAFRQRLTTEWWENVRGDFACFISQEVLDEAGSGSPEAVARRLEILKGLPLIGISDQSAGLADNLMTRGLFPPAARVDATHLALATVAGMDYLLTWNFRHLANAVILKRIEEHFDERGLLLPRVCTPEEMRGA